MKRIILYGLCGAMLAAGSLAGGAAGCHADGGGKIAEEIPPLPSPRGPLESVPYKLIAPSSEDIGAALLKANPGGVIPGKVFAAAALPTCTVDPPADIALAYEVTGLAPWLSFSGTTREISATAGEVPERVAGGRMSLDLVCRVADADNEEFFTDPTAAAAFVLNDADADGIGDADEFYNSRAPMVHPRFGAFALDVDAADTYLPVSAAGGAMLVNGLVVPAADGLDPLDPADADADFDGDGASNRQEIEGGTNAFVGGQEGDAAALFAAPVEAVGMGSARGLAALDANGDGWLDLAAVDAAPAGNLHVLINSPADPGTFPARTATPVELASDAASGDFNGDGAEDVAVTVLDAGGPDAVRIFLNDGAGAFSLSAERELPWPLLDGATIALAMDVDGDGALDIVTCAKGKYAIAWVLGNGAGGLGAAFSWRRIAGAGDIMGMAAHDIDGDGFLDLSVSSQPDQVHLLLNVPGARGARDFVLQETYPGAGSGEVRWLDANGDRLTDLAVADADSRRGIAILVGNEDGTFAAPAPSLAGSNVIDFVPFDADGDGDTDIAAIVAANPTDAVAILLNDGSGAFVHEESAEIGDGAARIVAADIDSDGDLDLAATNEATGSVSILENLSR